MTISVEIDKAVILPKKVKKSMLRKRVEADPKEPVVQCAIHYTTDIMPRGRQKPIMKCDQMRISLWEIYWQFLKT